MEAIEWCSHIRIYGQHEQMYNLPNVGQRNAFAQTFTRQTNIMGSKAQVTT